MIKLPTEPDPDLPWSLTALVLAGLMVVLMIAAIVQAQP